MSKKNILLTIWLALPITIVSLLMVWIFVSLDKDRLMDDAVPVGAGAGDTGNANAIGEWLAGHDADAISLAIKARREGLAIDPRDWPGGVEIRIPLAAFGLDPESTKLVFVDDQSLEILTQEMSAEDNGWAALVVPSKEAKGFFFYASTSDPVLTGNELLDVRGRTLRPIDLEPQIPDSKLQTSDPMVVEIRMESVFVESP